MKGNECFTDDDGNTTSSIDHRPYAPRPLRSGRRGLSQAAQDRWELITIDPGLVLGPCLTIANNSGSITTIHHVTAGFTPEVHGATCSSSRPSAFSRSPGSSPMLRQAVLLTG